MDEPTEQDTTPPPQARSLLTEGPEDLTAPLSPPLNVLEDPLRGRLGERPLQGDAGRLLVCGAGSATVAAGVTVWLLSAGLGMVCGPMVLCVGVPVSTCLWLSFPRLFQRVSGCIPFSTEATLQAGALGPLWLGLRLVVRGVKALWGHVPPETTSGDTAQPD